MYFFSFEVFPKHTNPEYGRVDGAFAAVFVNDSVQRAAETAARDLIEEAGWEIDGLDDVRPVTLDSFPLGDPNRDKFEQALVDGIVVTFHQWPVGAPEDDEDSDERAV